MDFYSKMADTANRLITDKGTTCTISSTTLSSGFDPETGMPLDSTGTTTQTGHCVVLSYGTDIINSPNTLIEQGDKRILLSAKGLSLDALNGKIETIGRVFSIIEAKELNPAGTVVIYEVHARGNI